MIGSNYDPDRSKWRYDHGTVEDLRRYELGATLEPAPLRVAVEFILLLKKFITATRLGEVGVEVDLTTHLDEVRKLVTVSNYPAWSEALQHAGDDVLHPFLADLSRNLIGWLPCIAKVIGNSGCGPENQAPQDPEIGAGGNPGGHSMHRTCDE
jgi:hypothetical protein